MPVLMDETPRRGAPLASGQRQGKRRAFSIRRLGDSPVSADFCDRLAKDGQLSESELKTLLDIRTRAITYRSGQLIAGDSDALPCLIILSGWAASQRILEDGDRQVFDLLTPGDSIGLLQGNRKPHAVSFAALTDLVTADASGLRRSVLGRAPGFTQALASAEQQAESRLYDHIVRLGRRSSYERLADFLFGLYTRLTDARRINGPRFPFPLTQEVLADCLGLTSIHVNRTLKQMRQDGLVRISSGWVEIENLDLLRDAAHDRPRIGADADWKPPE